MESKSEILVIEKSTGDTLGKFPMERSEKAYHFAAEMENLGLEVEVKAPGLPQTLVNELGITDKQSAEYTESIREEVESHDDSCCHD